MRPVEGARLESDALEPRREISPNPVPVVVMSPVRSPFQQNVSVSIPAGTLSNMVSFGVPAGFRLVIEYVSGSARGRQGARASQRRHERKRDVRTDARVPDCLRSWGHYYIRSRPLFQQREQTSRDRR